MPVGTQEDPQDQPACGVARCGCPRPKSRHQGTQKSNTPPHMKPGPPALARVAILSLVVVLSWPTPYFWLPAASIASWGSFSGLPFFLVLQFLARAQAFAHINQAQLFPEPQEGLLRKRLG